PVRVDVDERYPPAPVYPGDDERRRGDLPRHSEPGRDPLRDNGFPGTERTGQHDEVTRAQHPAEPAPEGASIVHCGQCVGHSLPSRKSSSAALTTSGRSSRATCPAPGTPTNSASGSMRQISAECSIGVSLSSSPQITSARHCLSASSAGYRAC